MGIRAFLAASLLENNSGNECVFGRLPGGEGGCQPFPVDEPINLRIVLKHIEFLLAGEKLPGGIDGDTPKIPADPLDNVHNVLVSPKLCHGINGFQGVINEVGPDLGFQRPVLVLQNLNLRLVFQTLLLHQLLQ